MFEYAKLRTAPIVAQGHTMGGMEDGVAEALVLVREQEVSYNLGRGFQHLGLKHLASPWYESYSFWVRGSVLPSRPGTPHHTIPSSDQPSLFRYRSLFQHQP